MAKYHINGKGNATVCRAAKQCPFGDLQTDHYSTKVEAQKAYETTMVEATLAAVEKPTNFSHLPKTHQNIYENSDAFYNINSLVDKTTVDHLTAYNYYRTLNKLTRSDESELQMLLAKKALLENPGGKDYQGWPYDDLELVEGTHEDYAKVPLPTTRKEENLATQETPRKDSFDEEKLRTYIHESNDWIKKLTPEEHNAVAYWTSAGSTVAGVATYGGNLPWRIELKDTTRRDYYNVKAFLSTVDNALDKSTLDEPIVVYRGINEDILGTEVVSEWNKIDKPATRKMLQERFPVGGEVTFDLPQSTSHSLDVARSFASPANIFFEVKAKKAAPVGVVSAWSAGEAEYLIPRTTKYRVLAVQEDVKYTTTARSGDERVESATVIQLEQL